MTRTGSPCCGIGAISLSRLTASAPRSLSRSHALRGDLTAQESKAGIPMSRIVLSGFSQGGALALYCAMHQSTAPAGVLAMSA